MIASAAAKFGAHFHLSPHLRVASRYANAFSLGQTWPLGPSDTQFVAGATWREASEALADKAAI